MIKFLLAVAVLVASIPFFAMPVAAATETDVVDTCSQVVKSDHADGTCVAAVSSYLDALKGTLSADQLDQAITSLVVKLSALVPPAPSCIAFNDEVAQAINTASGFSSSSDQKARLIEIGVTIKACKTATTASVGPPSDDTPPASTFASGNSTPTPG